MKNRQFFSSLTLLLFLVGVGCILPLTTKAMDMPTAAGSPIAGIAFDDRPLMLPDHRNFQMAMITASSEMGRSCGTMESYGWRLAPEEQNRVNLLFNNTVDRLRAQGYTVQARASKAVASDVTLFTADRADKNLLILWSAGEIGLVMVLCETSAPVSSSPMNFMNKSQQSTYTAKDPVAMAKTIRDGVMDTPVQLTRTGKIVHKDFTPKGKWVGKYTCIQGTTGAELNITSLKGDQFKGTFSFFPTDKNPFVAKGKYKVFGEYDRDGQRVLVNPGNWIERPDGYYNTIMIGSFDPVNMTFSAYFQGITGCTSFEATYAASTKPVAKPVKKKAKKKTKKRKKKKAVKKAAKKVVKKVVKKTVKKPTPKETTSKLEVKADKPAPVIDSIVLDAVQ